MPNYPINSNTNTNLYQALGVRPTAPVRQQPTPIPPPSEGPGIGASLYNALFGRQEASASTNPYENAAKALKSNKFIK